MEEGGEQLIFVGMELEIQQFISIPFFFLPSYSFCEIPKKKKNQNV